MKLLYLYFFIFITTVFAQQKFSEDEEIAKAFSCDIVVAKGNKICQTKANNTANPIKIVGREITEAEKALLVDVEIELQKCYENIQKDFNECKENPKKFQTKTKAQHNKQKRRPMPHCRMMCPRGQTLSRKHFCKCICKQNKFECRVHEQWDKKSCYCKPRVYCKKNCPQGQNLHPSFSCKCVNQNIVDWILSKDKYIVCKPANCKPYTVWNQQKCSCVQQPLCFAPCRAPQVMHPFKICHCVDPDEAEQAIEKWNRQNCKLNKCKVGFYIDKDKCECKKVKPKPCAIKCNYYNQEYDINNQTGECFCRPKKLCAEKRCPIGKNYNQSTCKCEDSCSISRMSCLKPELVMHPAGCLCVSTQNAAEYIRTYNQKWDEVERLELLEVVRKEEQEIADMINDFWKQIDGSWIDIFGYNSELDKNN